MITTDDRLRKLWTEYGNRALPADIGQEVAGHKIGDLDDEAQDAISSYFGMGANLGSDKIARLGLALLRIEQVLPHLVRRDTHDYFMRLAELSRLVLESIASGKA